MALKEIIRGLITIKLQKSCYSRQVIRLCCEICSGGRVDGWMGGNSFVENDWNNEKIAQLSLYVYRLNKKLGAHNVSWRSKTETYWIDCRRC